MHRVLRQRTAARTPAATPAAAAAAVYDHVDDDDDDEVEDHSVYKVYCLSRRRSSAWNRPTSTTAVMSSYSRLQSMFRRINTPASAAAAGTPPLTGCRSADSVGAGSRRRSAAGRDGAGCDKPTTTNTGRRRRWCCRRRRCRSCACCCRSRRGPADGRRWPPAPPSPCPPDAADTCTHGTHPRPSGRRVFNNTYTPVCAVDGCALWNPRDRQIGHQY